MTDEHRKLAREFLDNTSPLRVGRPGDIEALAALLADEMRKVRLEEAKWWHKNMPHAYAKVRWCIKRIAALSAPGTEEVTK